jgi:hypothetical protein
MKRRIIKIEFENIDPKDFPDFSDAMIIYAEYENGTPLTEAEIEKLDVGDYHDEMIQSLI